MELTADQCAVYAQVAPVFLLAAAALGGSWVQGPGSRNPGAPSPLMGFAILLGGIGSLAALSSVGDGADGFTAWVIVSATRGCALVVIALAVIENLVPTTAWLWIARRALARRERNAARKARRKKPLRPEPKGETQHDGKDDE